MKRQTLLGAAAGAIIGIAATIGLGFGLGGWQLPSMAKEHARAQVVEVLSDVCFQVVLGKHSRHELREMQARVHKVSNGPERGAFSDFDRLWWSTPGRFSVNSSEYLDFLDKCAERFVRLDVTSPRRGLHDELIYD